MNPRANDDPERRNEFSRKLAWYTKFERADQSDILFRIASNMFGMQRYKVALVGAPQVGKTKFISRHVVGKFVDGWYNPMRDVDVTPIVFSTSQGFPIMFELWDTPGAGGNAPRDTYWVGSDAAILMYDVTSTASYAELDGLYKSLTRVAGEDLPVVVIGNKSDIKELRCPARGRL